MDLETKRVPLAERMRPKVLSDVVGQDAIIGEGKIVTEIVKKGEPVNLIFWGPPGTGKTTLARILANEYKADFVELSAVTAHKSDVENVVKRARQNWNLRIRTVLFVDEIHRFNKAQQDAFLPHVESGLIILIGATTENPSFEVISPLLSRSRVVIVAPLSKDAIITVLKRAIKAEKATRRVSAKAIDYLAELSGGDARSALGDLELALSLSEKVGIETVKEAAGKKVPGYDKAGDKHYDNISAFIKSIRGSDPDAAIYWLGKMLVAGEDPRFIARRLVISASEDIGNADPRGLSVAVAAMQACDFVGMPECAINLAQATTYLASAPKSNASCMAISEAMADVESGAVQPVPEHLKNKHVRAIGSETVTEYKYPHNFANHYVRQDYMKAPKSYYRPTLEGYEATIAKRLAFLKS